MSKICLIYVFIYLFIFSASFCFHFGDVSANDDVVSVDRLVDYTMDSRKKHLNKTTYCAQIMTIKLTNVFETQTV